MTTYSKIQSKVFGEAAVDEIKCSEAITPGMLVEYTSAGAVQKHATAGGSNMGAIAIENTETGGDVTAASAANDFIKIWFPRKGDQAIVRLKASENVAIRDKLESAGDGTFRKAVADTSAGTIALNSVHFYCLEASNTGSVVLIKVRCGA